MFVGHYAVSFYMKAREPRVPIWILFVAVQLVDIMWGLLVLGGIERTAIVPGITAASPLDLIYAPYTHSLVASFGWSLLVFWLWFRFRGRATGGIRAAGLVGLAVLSHWVADLLVHRPDLPIYDNTAKVGLGLWNYPAISFPLEVLLLGAAMWYWHRVSNGATKGRNLVILWIVMTISQAYTNFGPLPTSTPQFVILALAFYLGFALASRISEASPSISTT
jgi:hypothetical protein